MKDNVASWRAWVRCSVSVFIIIVEPSGAPAAAQPWFLWIVLWWEIPWRQRGNDSPGRPMIEWRSSLWSPMINLLRSDVTCGSVVLLRATDILQKSSYAYGNVFSKVSWALAPSLLQWDIFYSTPLRRTLKKVVALHCSLSGARLMTISKFHLPFQNLYIWERSISEVGGRLRSSKKIDSSRNVNSYVKTW